MSDSAVRNLIVESASRHFSKYGFRKTTMDEIAKHVHKAKGVLYYYFKSKEELFNEVLKQELSQVKAELVKVSDSDEDYLTMVRKYFLTRLYLLSKALNYHETIKADFFERYEFVKDVRDDFIQFESRQLQKIFQKGIREGFVISSTVESLSNMVMMIVNSMEIPLYLQNKYSEHEGTIEEMVTLITNSLRTYRKA